jgi:tellurite resistance-related uncharacterized protein
MDNKEYVDAVNFGNYPEDIKVPLDKPFVDDRGVIQNLWLGQSGSITFIESVAWKTRAKHTHSKDWHSTWIIEGQIKYIEIENDVRTETVFSKGDMFFTRPGVYHEMLFLTDTKMITANGITKNHVNYEADVVRGK